MHGIGTQYDQVGTGALQALNAVTYQLDWLPGGDRPLILAGWLALLLRLSLAFLLAAALNNALPGGRLDIRRYLDLVALGTIADVVPHGLEGYCDRVEAWARSICEILNDSAV